MREGHRQAGRRVGERPPAKLRAPSLAGFALLALVGVAFLLHLRPWSFLCDDAFISFRYARNLGQHGALVYNLEPLERVEGYTNLLWVLILGLGSALGLAPHRLAPVLTAVASLAALALVALIGAALRRVFGPAARGQGEARAFDLVDLLAPALLVTVPEFVVWGSGGLETSFALALGLLAVWLWLRGRIEHAGLVAALAGLTRLDALVWIAAFGVGWLLVVGARKLREGRSLGEGIPWRRVGVAALCFALPLLAQLGFRRIYYGEWLPNTWAVKHHGALLRDRWGTGYLAFWADRLALRWLVPVVVLLRPRHLVLVLPILAQLAYAWSMGGDFMAYGRFMLPATALVGLLVSLALAEGRDELVARGWLSPPGALAAWAVLALALVVASASRIPARLAEDHAHALLHIDYEDIHQSPGFEGVQAMDRFASVRLAAGAQLAEVVPADTWISVGAAGALPYASGLPAFDAYGLVDPGVLAVAEVAVEGARPGHQLHAPHAYVLGREPDLMCHIGWEAPRPPRIRDARRRAGGGYRWACVRTGEIPDPRAESGTLPSRYYCCLRERDRFTELDPARLARDRREGGGRR